MNYSESRWVRRLSITLGAVAMLAVYASLAHAGPRLILQTEPEETQIDLTGVIRILPDGDISATPVDSAACAGSSDNCPVCDCDGVSVSFSSFTVNSQESPSSVELDQGSGLSFRWEGLGARECVSGGDLPGWEGRDLPSRALGSDAVSISTANLSAGNYDATLRCANGPVLSELKTVSVTINEPENPVQPTDCPADRQPPSGWVQQTQCHWDDASDNCAEFGSVWPGDLSEISGLTRRIASNRTVNTEYLSFGFSTVGMSPSRSGRLQFTAPTHPVTNSNKIITISSCPGDFNQTAVMEDTGCYWARGILPLTSTTIRWNGSETCQLAPDQNYYLNIIYTSDGPGTEPDEITPQTGCKSDGCGNNITVYSQ